MNLDACADLGVAPRTEKEPTRRTGILLEVDYRFCNLLFVRTTRLITGFATSFVCADNSPTFAELVLRISPPATQFANQFVGPDNKWPQQVRGDIWCGDLKQPGRASAYPLDPHRGERHMVAPLIPFFRCRLAGVYDNRWLIRLTRF